MVVIAMSLPLAGVSDTAGASLEHEIIDLTFIADLNVTALLTFPVRMPAYWLLHRTDIPIDARMCLELSASRGQAVVDLPRF